MSLLGYKATGYDRQCKQTPPGSCGKVRLSHTIKYTKEQTQALSAHIQATTPLDSTQIRIRKRLQRVVFRHFFIFTIPHTVGLVGSAKSPFSTSLLYTSTTDQCPVTSVDKATSLLSAPQDIRGCSSNRRIRTPDTRVAHILIVSNQTRFPLSHTHWLNTITIDFTIAK